MKEIAFVTGHCCIRVLKEAYTLVVQDGWKIHLIVGGEIFGPLTATRDKYMPMFESINFYSTQNQLEQAIRLISKKVYVFHVHNEPSWPVTKIRELIPDSKIILDYHDSNYWRAEEKSWPEEDVACQCADGFIVPSDACKKELEQRTDKSIAVLPSACPYEWYRHIQHGAGGGIVSQGGHTVQEIGGGEWRDYTDIYSALRGKVSVFACSPQFTHNPEAPSKNVYITKHYEQMGVHISNFPYDHLLNVLGNFHWNLVGNWKKNGKRHKVWDYSNPNKFYDAIAAGIPSVVFGVPEVESIVGQCDIGLVCKSPSELLSKWDCHIAKRKNLMMTRKKFSMENYIQSAINMYQEMGK